MARRQTVATVAVQLVMLGMLTLGLQTDVGKAAAAEALNASVTATRAPIEKFMDRVNDAAEIHVPTGDVTPTSTTPVTTAAEAPR